MQKGGIKLRRCNKKKGKYEAQYYKTERNKNQQKARRRTRKEFWLIKGVKKNGQTVRSVGTLK